MVRTVLLRDEWFDTEADEGAYAHVIGHFDRQGECVIDDSQNVIVIHPDRLVSATVVADSFTCMRRAVLQDRVKATSEPTPPLVYGTILHEIFQAALTAARWDPAFLSGVIDSVMVKHVEDLYTIKVGLTSELSRWADTFVSATPKVRTLVISFGFL
jgi:DNA replication ATP-dependent helicase Dna2